ncbi:MAG TPA: hypothetical protein VHE30_06145 [Polyangiaceae bacterium]|nr:hypothetical protein [Polyangiaceae bacterium]
MTVEQGRNPKLARIVDALVLLGALFLFEAPAALEPNRWEIRLLRPSGEALLLLLFARAAARRRARRGVWRALGGASAVLLVFRVDRAFTIVATRAEPNLWDQLFLVKHLAVLAVDVFRTGAAGVVLAIGATVAVAVLGGTWVARNAARALVRTTGSSVLPDLLLGAALVVGTWAGARPRERPLVPWIAPDLVASVRRSVELAGGAPSSAGAARPPLPAIARRPDVAFVFVESYGRIVAEDHGLRPAFTAALGALSEELSTRGLRTASGFATAPVSGGRSWLAVASILLGRPIRTETEFRRAVAGGEARDGLPGLFERAGWDTVLLAPADRARLGVDRDNPFGYRHYVGLDDLDYRGAPVGWGVVPDDVSLARVEGRLLARETAPVFFHFHMVSSHTPWLEVPEGAPPLDVRCEHAPLARLCTGYARSVLFDLRVALDFAARRADGLVVVLGDHQPPFLVPREASFDVPVHVVARDPSLLAEFFRRGFSPGVDLPTGDRPVRAEDLGALVVRAVVRARASASASR